MLRSSIGLILWLVTASAPAQPTTTIYTVDTTTSDVRIHVDRAGVFSFVGHTHEVRAPAHGHIVVVSPDISRSTVQVEFDASALRVTGKGEPADDVPEVQRTMEGERVLDVARFPRMAFTSRKIEVTEQRGDRLKLRVTGELMLHGTSRTEQADVSVLLTTHQLTANGTLVVRQTDYGIQPVTAGAGTVRVKDALRITFTVVARTPAP